MPRNSDYDWRVDQDAMPARSRQLKTWGKEGHDLTHPGYLLEVRVPEGLAGSRRLGELFVTHRSGGLLTCSLIETDV